MAETPQPETGNPSSSPASSAPAGTNPPTPPEPWRAGDESPPWMRGKTGPELQALAEQMYGALAQMTTQPQPQPQPQPTGHSAFDWNRIQDGDVVDGQTFKQGLVTAAQAVQAQYQQQMQKLYQMQAETNLAQVRRENKKEFEKYGPEILTELGKVPQDMWSLANLDHVVNLVRGRHVREFAAELARDLASQQDPTLRPTGSSGDALPAAPHTQGGLIGGNQLPADYQALLKAKGVTDETVRAFCAQNGLTVDQWVETAKKHKASVITERSTRGA